MTDDNPTEVSFEDRLRAARGGDAEALEGLLHQTGTRIRRLARSRLGPRLRREIQTSDVVQSTYFDIVRDIRKIDAQTEDDFVRWVGCVLENNLRQKTRYFDAKKRQAPPTLEQDLRHREPAPSTASAESHLGERVHLVCRALKELPEDYQQIILLRVIEDRSHDDIADLMGRPPGSTRMLLSRARTALTLALDQLEENDADETS